MHRAQTGGFTPFLAVASANRSEAPSVSTRWAWWRNRSTAAVASDLGMMVSNPAGRRRSGSQHETDNGVDEGVAHDRGAS